MGKSDYDNSSVLKVARIAAIVVVLVWALTFLLFFIEDSGERG